MHSLGAAISPDDPLGVMVIRWAVQEGENEGGGTKQDKEKIRVKKGGKGSNKRRK